MVERPAGSAWADALAGHRDCPRTPLLVTETGAAVDAAGAVHDADRIDHLRGHVNAVRDAMGRGVDVRGYFVWSLLDNFEWAWGYSKRSASCTSTSTRSSAGPKDSAHWYRDLIAGRRHPG